MAKEKKMASWARWLLAVFVALTIVDAAIATWFNIPIITSVILVTWVFVAGGAVIGFFGSGSKATSVAEIAVAILLIVVSSANLLSGIPFLGSFLSLMVSDVAALFAGLGVFGALREYVVPALMGKR